MSQWVRHKGVVLAGDGEICIAGPHGPLVCSVTDGAFEWPDSAGPVRAPYEPCEPTPQARERRRLEEIGALEAEAERLGFRLAQLREQGIEATTAAPQAAPPGPGDDAPAAAPEQSPAPVAAQRQPRPSRTVSPPAPAAAQSPAAAAARAAANEPPPIQAAARRDLVQRHMASGRR